MLSKLISEVGIYKRNQKVRIQENNNSTEKAIKKTRKKENKNLTKKKRKKVSFLSLSCQVLVFFLFVSFSCFLTFLFSFINSNLRAFI